LAVNVSPPTVIDSPLFRALKVIAWVAGVPAVPAVNELPVILLATEEYAIAEPAPFANAVNVTSLVLATDPVLQSDVNVPE
jgi:hypothetical protein